MDVDYQVIKTLPRRGISDRLWPIVRGRERDLSGSFLLRCEIDLYPFSKLESSSIATMKLGTACSTGAGLSMAYFRSG